MNSDVLAFRMLSLIVCLSESSAIMRSPNLHVAPPPTTLFVQTSLFCGRLPKNFSLTALQAAASSPPLAGGGVGYVPCLGASHCRATCVFLEFADAATVQYVSSYMNGSPFCGVHIIAVPAFTLSRLFIGNVSRTCSAAVVREAIARVEPVRAHLVKRELASCSQPVNIFPPVLILIPPPPHPIPPILHYVGRTDGGDIRGQLGQV